MSDRAAGNQTNASGKSAYDAEINYWIAEFSKREIESRIRGLFRDELIEWVRNCPPNETLIKWLAMQQENTEIERETWGWALTQARKETFEKFVDRESRESWLTALIEAEAERDNPRGERIGYVNQRKAEL